jgi:hypothetical protein
MEIHPPIPDRTTEQLMEIIETQEQWLPNVVDSAQKELTRRGIPIKTQKIRRTNRTNLQRRIETIKARATYTAIEKVLIVFIGPILVLFLRDFFLFHSGEGYKMKNRQGLFYLLLGIGLWGVVLFVWSKISD